MSTPSTSSSVNKEYDDSPPRNGIIFFYSVLTVFFLIGVKFLLDSYFAKTMDSEIHEKVLTRGMEQVATMRAKEKETLERSGISAAIKTLAQRGRSASPLIAPTSGQGKPEIQGWTQLGRQVEAPTVPGTPEQTTVSPGTQPAEPAPQPGPGNNPNEAKPASSVNPAGR